MWAQIVGKGKDLYQGNKKAHFLPGLVFELCRRAGVPEDDTNVMVENDDPFNPLLVRKKPPKSRKKRKIGEAESSRDAKGLGKEDDDDGEDDAPLSKTQHSFFSSCLEEVWLRFGGPWEPPLSELQPHLPLLRFMQRSAGS